MLQVRSLLEGVVNLVTVLEGPRALRGALPALIGHELVFPRAHLGVFQCGGIVGNGDASAGIVDQLVTLLDFLLVPFVGHAGERASVICRRAGIRLSLGQFESALESAATEGVRQAIASVRPAATSALIFAGAPAHL